MLSIPSPSSSVDACGSGLNPLNVLSSIPKDVLDKKKKKRKKRSREDDQPNAGEATESRKKRKENGSHSGDHLVPVENPSAKDKEAPSKNIDKGKGKEKVTPLSEQTDAEIEANSQASAAALLSAIVAVTGHPLSTVQPHFDSTFNPYAPVHYGFPMPQVSYDPNGSQHPSMFSNPPGTSITPTDGNFTDLAFVSNEDILRALRDLDMSKIASVLKSIGEAAASAQNSPFPNPMPFMAPQLDQRQPTAAGQPSIGVLAFVDPKQNGASLGHKRIINMSLPGNEQHAHPDHAYVLANKWLSTNRLAELVRTEGLVYRKGKFSAIEEQQTKAAIDKYQFEKGLSNDDILEIIFAKNEKTKDTAFWSEITAAVPLRPIIAVYHYVRRAYHPMKLQGQWKEAEDTILKQAVADLGQQWEKVSARVGRMSSDCRDRYRNHIVNRDIRLTGGWTKEEEDKLTEIVTDMTVKQGKDIDNDVFWGVVSDRMGGKRGRQQCRIKWTDALSKTVKNQGQKPRWSQQDAFILVHKVDSLSVRDDTEIDWKLMADPDWNLWSAHTLQRRWLTLKKSVKGYEDMTHQEIMDILRIKKAHLPALPPPSTRKRKERKVTSAPAVNDPDSRDSNETTPEAGPSNAAAALTNGTQEDSSEDEPTR